MFENYEEVIVTMKLGEALKIRSDNYKRIEELRARAVASAQIQEGTAAPDSALELVKRIEDLVVKTQSLVQRVNRTNVNVRLNNGQTVADAIVERDHYLLLRGNIEAVAHAASEPQQRYMRSEIRVVRTIDPVELRKTADELSRQHRELDVVIQEANWANDLVE